MRKRILVIESNRRVLEILSFALGREGYEIIRANNGLTGLQLFEEQPPDLIILDVAAPIKPDDMPSMDSLDICRCLREENTAVPILVLAASDGEKDELLSSGADDYLIKPFAMRELLARVKVNTWHLEAQTSASKLLK